MPELPHRTIMPAKRRDPGSAKPLIAPPAEIATSQSGISTMTQAFLPDLAANDLRCRRERSTGRVRTIRRLRSTDPGTRNRESERRRRSRRESRRPIDHTSSDTPMERGLCGKKTRTAPKRIRGGSGMDQAFSGWPTICRSRRACWQPASSSELPQAFRRRCRWRQHPPTARPPCYAPWPRPPPATHPRRP